MAQPQRIESDLLSIVRAELDEPAISLTGPLIELTGGFDTSIIAFSLDGAPPEFSERLVLRLFSPTDNPNRATREAVVQNAVADLDFPAPRALLTSNGGLVDDSPFMVMEWVDGRTFMDLFTEGAVELEAAMNQLTGMAASLHNLSESALSEALEEAGLGGRSSGPEGWLHSTSEWVRVHELEGLMETIGCCAPTGPYRDRLSICYGDLHLLNLLVRSDGRGVLIDWSHALLADPEFELGIGLTVFAAAPAVVPNMTAHQLLQMRTGLEAGLLEAYARRREFSPERVRYNQVLRAARAMAHSAHIRAVGGTGLRSDVYAWEQPEVLDALAQSVHRLTGLSARVPGMD